MPNFERTAWNAYFDNSELARMCPCPSCNFYLPDGQHKPESECAETALIKDIMAAALRDVAAWLATAGYPVDFNHMPPAPEPLWEAVVDHYHSDPSGNLHGNSLSREEVARWLNHEAGR